MATWDEFAAQYGSGPLGALTGVHNSKLFDTMANQIAKAIGFTGKTWIPGTYEFQNSNEGGTFTDTAKGKQASPEFLKALEAYQFSRDASKLKGTISKDGQNVGTFTAGNKDTGFDKFANVAIPVGLAAIGGQLAGGLLSGGAGEAAASGASGASGGSSVASSIGAGEGAAQLAAYTAANPLTVAEVMATIPASGLPGLGAASGGLLGGLPMITANPLPAIEAFTAANPLTAAQVTASTLPAGGLPGLSGGLLSGLPTITADPLPAIESFTAANPVTAAELTAGMPNIAPASAAPSVFNAAKDSQAYNQAAGITGSQAASAATVPSTVNLGTFADPAFKGGTMATAGGLQGAANTAAQAVRDATAGSAIEGGGLLSQVGNTVGNAIQTAGSAISPALQWLKDNPTLGRLALGGATSLLSSMGGSGGSSGGGSAVPFNPVQWNSQMQKGLLAPVQQYAPEAIQKKPAGLLAQGYANDGAWRYLGG